MDTEPTKHQARLYWKKRLHLSEYQTKHLTIPLMEQLVRCKDEEARRILMRARMEGHAWRSNSAPPEP
jgi:hypothetical protein